MLYCQIVFNCFYMEKTTMICPSLVRQHFPQVAKKVMPWSAKWHIIKDAPICVCRQDLQLRLKMGRQSTNEHLISPLAPGSSLFLIILINCH